MPTIKLQIKSASLFSFSSSFHPPLSFDYVCIVTSNSLVRMFAFNSPSIFIFFSIGLFARTTLRRDKMIQHLSRNQLRFCDTSVLSPLRFISPSSSSFFTCGTWNIQTQFFNGQRHVSITAIKLLTPICYRCWIRSFFRLKFICAVVIVDTNERANERTSEWAGDELRTSIHIRIVDVCKSFKSTMEIQRNNCWNGALLCMVELKW